MAVEREDLRDGHRLFGLPHLAAVKPPRDRQHRFACGGLRTGSTGFQGSATSATMNGNEGRRMRASLSSAVTITQPSASARAT